jgi:hypothetical protein
MILSVFYCFLVFLVLVIWEQWGTKSNSVIRPSLILNRLSTTIGSGFFWLGATLAQFGWIFEYLYEYGKELLVSASSILESLWGLVKTPLEFTRGYWHTLLQFQWILTPVLSAFFWNVLVTGCFYLVWNVTLNYPRTYFCDTVVLLFNLSGCLDDYVYVFMVLCGSKILGYLVYQLQFVSLSTIALLVPQPATDVPPPRATRRRIQGVDGGVNPPEWS